MPTNHGIYKKITASTGQRLTAAESPVFRFGILQAFEAMKTFPWPETAGKESHERVGKAAQLEHHFRKLTERLVFHVQELNHLTQELIKSHSTIPNPENVAITLEAECTADHILTYLNILVDDIAVLVARIVEYEKADDISMAKLLRLNPKSPDKALRNRKEFALVESLIEATDSPNSWWSLAFATKKGTRQRIIHNQHLIGFQVAGKTGEPLDAIAVVMSPFNDQIFSCHDYFGQLHSIFTDLFNWLDKLELTLIENLNDRLSDWSPRRYSTYYLPIGYPQRNTRYDAKYFPIPICDDSDPLPWDFS